MIENLIDNQSFRKQKRRKVETLSYKTQHAKKETHTREWFLVDAQDKTLGRMCSEIAKIIRGKHKPSYTAHFDAGDYVVVINSNKVKLSGNKWNAKQYVTYSGYPSGQKKIVAKDLNKKKPIALVENSVRGMLPKNRLGRQMLKKLFVYEGTEHKHAAQKPTTINL